MVVVVVVVVVVVMVMVVVVMMVGDSGSVGGYGRREVVCVYALHIHLLTSRGCPSARVDLRLRMSCPNEPDTGTK